MHHRDALALDDVDAHGGGIEEHVDDVVVEQVDLVHVEDVAIRLGQHAGLEAARAFLEGRLEVDGPDDAVLRGVDGQLHDAHAAGACRQGLARLEPGLAVEAERFPIARAVAEAATRHHLLVGQQPSQGAHRGGLAGAFLAADQHPADGGVDRVQDQRRLHAVLADDGAEGIRVALD